MHASAYKLIRKDLWQGVILVTTLYKQSHSDPTSLFEYKKNIFKKLLSWWHNPYFGFGLFYPDWVLQRQHHWGREDADENQILEPGVVLYFVARHSEPSEWGVKN